MAVGGWDNIAVLTRVDIFPLPSCSLNTALCSIPQLPRPRLDHSLSLLPSGKMVVCGGRDFDYNSGQFYTLNTCISFNVYSKTGYKTLQDVPHDHHHLVRKSTLPMPLEIFFNSSSFRRIFSSSIRFTPLKKNRFEKKIAKKSPAEPASLLV